ncbi:DUF998 domain-containing protein [Fodinicola acaciae]|uniref:DUF998 domain-containing protein n=1 Tax=Fodinicola acaciae TaxID=2681555 RepID=UPI0013CFAF72|nr:DUF998 domain-containing protein [Fodinicola acaciae]
MSLPIPNHIRANRLVVAAHRSPMPARIAIAATVAYWLLSAAVVIVNPQWNPLTRQLSEYALARHGWLQVAAFLALALAYGMLTIAVRTSTRGLAGRIGLVILLVCTLGSAGVGVFVTDPMTTSPDQLTTRGLLHTAFGGGALILLPIAALLITRSIARNHQPRTPRRRHLYRLALLPLAGLLLIWVPEAAGLIPAGGWPDRVLFLAYTAWVIALATSHSTPLDIEKGG